MKIKVHHIWAYKSYLRVCYVEINGIIYPFYIKQETYDFLKSKGVPTSQYLRYKK